MEKFQIGEEVFVGDFQFGVGYLYKKGVVCRTTGTGQIVVDVSGKERRFTGKGNGIGHKGILKKADEDIKKEYEKQKIKERGQKAVDKLHDKILQIGSLAYKRCFNVSDIETMESMAVQLGHILCNIQKEC